MPTLIGMFSGGKDSLVACHISAVEEVIYCKTGIGLPENEKFVTEQCRKYGWKLHVLTPKEGNSYEDFVAKFGFPKPRIHSAVMGYLKWFPIRKFAKENKHRDITFVSGRRMFESKRRMQVTGKEKYAKTVQVEKNIRIFAPILDWEDHDVLDYIKLHKLEICPVYQTMHLSGDCMCGAFAGLGESDLLATFHPEMAARIHMLEDKARQNLNRYMKGKKSESRIALRREMIRWGKGEGKSVSEALLAGKMTDYLDSEIEDLICSDCKIIQT